MVEDEGVEEEGVGGLGWAGARSHGQSRQLSEGRVEELRRGSAVLLLLPTLLQHLVEERRIGRVLRVYDAELHIVTVHSNGSRSTETDIR